MVRNSASKVNFSGPTCEPTLIPGAANRVGYLLLLLVLEDALLAPMFVPIRGHQTGSRIEPGPACGYATDVRLAVLAAPC